VRDGRFRCKASFSHPVMAGSFGASTIALLEGLWLVSPKRRILHTAGLVAAMAMVYLCASSGPIVASAAAIVGWALFPVRQYVSFFRWTAAAAVVCIHFAREKPVWHLMGRLGSIMGGEGWHRYELVDQFIKHIDEWWLAGTSSTTHWTMQITSDFTNQYVLEGVQGGLPKLLSFIAILVVAFQSIGRSLTQAQSSSYASRGDRHYTVLLAWCLGVCLFTHSVGFMAISYFGQLQSVFFFHLALISSLACAQARFPGGRAESARPVEPTLQRGVA
jgi:hypothetical protein